jgi:hypothetical protein
MKRELSDNVSYFMKPDGTIHAVMPDQEPTFSPQQLHGFIGQEIELACRTPDGYFLLRSKEGNQQDLPINEAATAVCEEVMGPGHVILGNALLVHPDHKR